MGFLSRSQVPKHNLQALKDEEYLVALFWLHSAILTVFRFQPQQRNHFLFMLVGLKAAPASGCSQLLQSCGQSAFVFLLAILACHPVNSCIIALSEYHASPSYFGGRSSSLSSTAFRVRGIMTPRIDMGGLQLICMYAVLVSDITWPIFPRSQYHLKCQDSNSEP